jgi:hypothetical protein
MTYRLLSIILLSFFFFFINHALSISYKIEIPIVKNGPSVTDTLDNGQIVTYDVSSDDAEQENNKMDKLYDDDLDTGWEGDPEDQNILHVGLRFQNVAIPKGAKIDSAFILLNCHENKTTDDVAKITIYGENSDNPNTYDLESLISDRPKTTAMVKWTVSEEWEIWKYYRTPDLKNIVQEIVNRNGWNPGNSLAIMLFGENQGPSDFENAREFESFENISDPEEGGDGQNHPERVPTLYVYYSFATDVPESEDDFDIHIHPNPVLDGNLYILGKDLNNTTINIVNQLGITLNTFQTTTNNVINLSINNLPSGLYYIILTKGSVKITRKIIKY